MTLREYIIFWQETYDKHQSRPTTYAAHNYVFKNHILPGLGDIPLSELTSEMIGDFLEERRRFGNHRPGSSGLGEETMRHIHRLLQQCLDQAMRDGLISDNPARAFHYSKPKKVNADVLFLLELEYGGTFHIEGVSDDQIHPFLLIECPRLMFPFVRRIISDVTRDGGFPPLNVDTVDFMALYRQELARRAQAQAAQVAPSEKVN